MRLLATDDSSLADTIHRLRTGSMGAEHSPIAIAGLIERLVAERAALGRQVRELEAFVTPRTGSFLTNIYALGFRDATEEVLTNFPLDDMEDEIRSLKPSYDKARQYVSKETRQ